MANSGAAAKSKWSRLNRQTWTVLVSAALFVALAAGVSLIPVPFVVWSPGASVSVSNRADGSATVAVGGIAAEALNGQVLSPTVQVTPADNALSLAEAVIAFLRDSYDVMPRDVSYPVGQPFEQVKIDQDDEVDQAQRSATVAALLSAGVDVQPTAVITAVVPSGPAASALRVGDIIEAVDSVRVTSKAEVDALIAKHTPGEMVYFDILRGDVSSRKVVTTVTSNDDSLDARPGITVGNSFRFDPITVDFDLDAQFSSSSSSLALALVVYDMISADDLLAGRSVAATGSIDTSGTVSQVSGVRERLHAVQAGGAAIFLVPAGNCTDIAGVSTDVRIVKVTSLDEAIAALKVLQDDPTSEAVPGC